MAGKYDDLLESFMNNSAKVFDEDKKCRKNSLIKSLRLILKVTTPQNSMLKEQELKVHQ